jgi:predicted transposase/invertase (TIGR01784 family)
MKRPIDPRVDCVFKALLGSKENTNLLVHFINAILGSELSHPVKSATIENPYNDKQFLDDKLSIVDVKATDDQGRTYQLEIQIVRYSHLPSRMLYTWASLHSRQLRKGDTYGMVRPTYAIWLLGGRLWLDNPDYIHAYRMQDSGGRPLLDHGGIWVVELEKFRSQEVRSETDRWLRFFRDGERLDDGHLPDWMMTEPVH